MIPGKLCHWWESPVIQNSLEGWICILNSTIINTSRERQPMMLSWASKGGDHDWTRAPVVFSISFLSPPFLLIQRNHVSQILSCFSFLGQMFLMNGPSTIPHCASFLRIAALLPTFPRRSEVIQPKPVLLSPRPSPDLKLPGPVHVAAPSTAADTRDSWLVSPHKQVFGGPC